MKPVLSSMNDEALKAYLAEKKAPLLVSFWAPWSSSSQILEQTLGELAHDYQKRVQISMLNIDENAHSPAEYGIRSVPHLVLFDQGEAVASFSGAQPKNKLVEIIESHLSS
ncbi:MAG: thioredoxin fold domain-containing protein [Chitinophagaceae bacterium]|nr:thioredoxin fold domain-containing protein [Oligoflexus sp.]